MLRFLNNRPSNERKREATPPQPAGLAKPADFAQPQPANSPAPPPAQPAGNFYANHQSFLAYLNDLLRAGHGQQDIQAKWQQYYDNLTDLEKETIWRQVNSRQSQVAPAAVPAAQPEPVSPAVATPGFGPQTPSEDQAVEEEILPTVNPNSQTHARKASERLKNFKNRRFSNFLNAPAKVKKYAKKITGRGSPTLQQQPTPPPAPVDPNLHPSLQPGVHPSNLGQIMPDTKLSHKARNAFSWNSPSALFDKEETSSIRRQNIKSALFGLTVGLIVFVAYQFTFFNDRYLQPFIQPSTISSDVQVIIPPGERTISDPTWRVIIPKLGIDPRVESGVEAYRSVNSKESPDAFENRMQDALQKGVAHYPTSQLPGQTGQGFRSNVVILGHSSANLFGPGSYKSIFSNLRNLDLGDLILVNYKKKQYVYKIYEKKIVKPSQTEVLKQARLNNSLTLITCDPPGSNANRLVVVAQQISPDIGSNLNVNPSDSNDDGIIVPSNSRSFTEVLF